MSVAHPDILAIIEAARRAGDPNHLIAALPYARYLGLTATLRDGELIAGLPFRRDLVGNPVLPALHGGAVGGFLELTAALVLLWRLESDALPRSVTLSVDYLRAAGPRECFARGRVTRLGRRVANVAVEAWQEDPEKPFAQAQTHMLVTPHRPGLS